jgi:hypothetical protein
MGTDWGACTLYPFALERLCVSLESTTAARTSCDGVSIVLEPGTVDSRALFSEAAKVITSARCMNCHPADDHPTQGNDMHRHQPPVSRGVGVCQTCHTDRNYTLMERASFQSIPGHPRWDMAPIEMAWQGKSVGEICQQLTVATLSSCTSI